MRTLTRLQQWVEINYPHNTPSIILHHRAWVHHCHFLFGHTKGHHLVKRSDICPMSWLMLRVSTGVLNMNSSNVGVLLLLLAGSTRWWCHPNKFKLLIVARILHIGHNKGGLYWRTFEDREEIHILAANCSKGIQSPLIAFWLKSSWSCEDPESILNIAASRHEKTQQANEDVKFLGRLEVMRVWRQIFWRLVHTNSRVSMASSRLAALRSFKHSR